MESEGAVIDCDTSRLCALGCGSASHHHNTADSDLLQRAHTTNTSGDVIEVALE